MLGNYDSKCCCSKSFMKYFTTWCSLLKFDKRLPLIHVVALVTSKFHQNLQLRFQSSNLHFDLEGWHSAVAATVKLK